jgi:hypothetical protein
LHALVVVVDGDGKLLLGLVLADHVFVEEGFDFLRLGEVGWGRSSGGLRTIVFEDRVTNRDTLVADVSARIVARR